MFATFQNSSVLPTFSYHLSNYFRFLFQLQYSKEQLDFFPLNRSLALQHTEEDDNEIKMERLMAQVAFLVQKRKEEVSHWESCEVSHNFFLRERDEQKYFSGTAKANVKWEQVIFCFHNVSNKIMFVANP